MENIQMEKNEPMEQLWSHIGMTYLAQLYCICILWTNSDFDQTRILKPFPVSNNENANLVWLNYAKQSDVDELVRTGIDVGCQAFVAAPDSALLFLDSFDRVRFTAKNRYHLMRLVVLPSKLQRTESILSHPVIQDVPNLLIIDQTNEAETKSFNLITSQFVGRFNNTTPRYLDTFIGLNETLVANANLFPDKFSNLQGKDIRLSLFNYNPYSIWEEVAPGTGNANSIDSYEEKTLRVDGTEALLILEFCKIFNCTVNVFHDDEAEWGNVYDNFTGDGVSGAIVERRVDLGVTALYSWHHEFQFLEFSSPITRTGVTCICPKPRLIGGWLFPIMPFTSSLWIAEGISFVSIVAAVFMIRLVKRFLNEQPADENSSIIHVWLQIWAIFLLQSVNFMSRHIPAMIIVGCCLLMSLLIGNAYSGGLASIMTAPQYEQPIDDYHQLAGKSLEWAATHDAWIFSILSATEPDMKKLVDLFQALPYEKLVPKTTTQDVCFSLERLPYGHYAVGDYIDENALKYLQLMRNDIYYEYCVAMFYKTWPFKTVIDLFILNVVESGLQKYLEIQTVDKYTDAKIQLGIAISRQRENVPVGLKLENFSGAFILWIMGISVATCVFVIELAWYRIMRRGRKHLGGNPRDIQRNT